MADDHPRCVYLVGDRYCLDGSLDVARGQRARARTALMDVSGLLDGLNTAQREAVSAPPGHYLVLAGAGSGKTRVLTHRMGWLNQVHGVPAHGIFAVTFTSPTAAALYCIP